MDKSESVLVVDKVRALEAKQVGLVVNCLAECLGYYSGKGNAIICAAFSSESCTVKVDGIELCKSTVSPLICAVNLSDTPVKIEAFGTGIRATIIGNVRRTDKSTLLGYADLVALNGAMYTCSASSSGYVFTAKTVAALSGCECVDFCASSEGAFVAYVKSGVLKVSKINPSTLALSQTVQYPTLCSRCSITAHGNKIAVTAQTSNKTFAFTLVSADSGLLFTSGSLDIGAAGAMVKDEYPFAIVLDAQDENYLKTSAAIETAVFNCGELFVEGL